MSFCGVSVPTASVLMHKLGVPKFIRELGQVSNFK